MTSMARRTGWLLVALLIIGLGGTAGVMAALRLKPTGRVTDVAGVIDEHQTQQLETLLAEVERQTSAEMAVVTVPTVTDGDIETAAVELFRDWGIGKRGKDNGVLILCAIRDRRVRIEVGYGLEHVLTDAICGRIIREQMVPQFRAGRYADGLIAGALSVAELVARDAGLTLTGLLAVHQTPVTSSVTTIDWNLVFFVVLILLSFVIRVGIFGWSSLFGFPYYGGGGWSGGGFGGGSFGGFGGGSSGGGGASGSW